MAEYGVGMEIEIDSRALTRLRHELSLFAPDLKKGLDKQLRKIATGIVSDAKVRTPSRTGAMRGGYRVKRKARGDDLAYSAINATRAGAILEFAKESKCAQGASLVSTLTTRYGSPGRFLWDAFDRSNTVYKVQAVIAETSAAFEARVRRF